MLFEIICFRHIQDMIWAYLSDWCFGSCEKNDSNERFSKMKQNLRVFNSRTGDSVVSD